MKLFCISDDQDISVGLRLSGIDGITLNNKKEIEEKIEETCNKKDIGILVVTQNIYQMAKDKIEDIQLNRSLPLIVKIPNKD